MKPYWMFIISTSITVFLMGNDILQLNKEIKISRQREEILGQKINNYMKQNEGWNKENYEGFLKEIETSRQRENQIKETLIQFSIEQKYITDVLRILLIPANSR